MTLSEFIKERRGASKLTQPELAEKAGVGLRFVREVEQGKETLRLDKVNQLLKLFGYEMGPVEIRRSRILNASPATLKLQEEAVAVKQKKKRK